MATSETIGEISKALSKAQTEFKPVLKTAVNPFFKSKYATLDNVIDATRKALDKNGLCITQLPDGEVLRTMLIHSTGEWISCDTPLYLAKKDSQGQGSAITYSRRYGLSAILNVASEVDDDGNSNKKPKEKPYQMKTKSEKSTSMTTEQKLDTLTMFPEFNAPDFLTWLKMEKNYKGATVEDLPADWVDNIINNWKIVKEQFLTWKKGE